MVGKSEIEPLKKVTLNLYESDYLRLSIIYETLGPTVAIRQIVRRHLEKLREQEKTLDV